MKTLCFFLGLFTIVLGRQVTFTNKRADTIWVAILSNPDKPVVNGGGFELDAGQSETIDFEDNWAGRFWGRTGCDDDNKCVTGDCGEKLECDRSEGEPPVTLVELNFNGADKDSYYITLVDGFNIGAGIEATNRDWNDDPYYCTNTYCFDINANCPDELKVYDNGQIVGCLSSCAKYKTNEQYCCTGPYGQPDTCKSDDWPQPNSAAYFKTQCRLVYSYLYDSKTKPHSCNDTDYIVTFQ